MVLKPCKSWNKLTTSTGAGFQPSTVSFLKVLFGNPTFPSYTLPFGTPPDPCWSEVQGIVPAWWERLVSWLSNNQKSHLKKLGGQR